MNESSVVKKYDFIEPDIHEIIVLPDDIIVDCRNKYLHTFDYRLNYDIKFTIISNNNEVKFTITHRSMEVGTEFYGFKKTKYCSKKRFYIQSNK